jgi:hypothetical protein
MRSIRARGGSCIALSAKADPSWNGPTSTPDIREAVSGKSARRAGDPYAIGIMSTPMLVNPDR